MKYSLYTDVKDFYRDTYDIMMRHETQNLIPLGNVIIGNAGDDKSGWRDPVNWFMATVTDGTGIRLTAIMTPPHNLTLYATDNQIDDAAISCLIEGIAENGVVIPGVMTEKTLAERFAQAYCAAKNLKYKVTQNQRVYELTRVNSDIPLIGSLRLSRESDMAFMPYWTEHFNYECFGTGIEKWDLKSYESCIMSKYIYILEDNGIPVSTARLSREMRSVIGMSMVYTPPYFRNKGYASSCVAQVSQAALDRGFTKCALYTDLANPVSNSIYQKIGYVPVCDSLQIAIS